MDPRRGAYVFGFTCSTDFPTTAGAFDTSQQRQLRRLRHQAESRRLDAALLHLPGRQRLRERRRRHRPGLPGQRLRVGLHLLDRLPTTAGAFDTSFNGICDAFVTKLNSAGSKLRYSTFLGGSAFEAGGASPWTSGATPM